MLLSSNRELLMLLRNDLVHDATTNWTVIELDTRANPLLVPNGYGTRAEITSGGASQVRYLHGGCHYMGTAPLDVHAGLAAAVVIDEIVLRWPDGAVDVSTDQPVNQYLKFYAQ